jgi:hypothetical protein
MADQWIDAATAASIVANGPEEQTGKRSLCTRAHHGLIKARARFIISSSAGRSERRVRNALVPRDLWWAGEHEALKQDWASGDFSTWIDQRVQLQAFGVRFALDGLLDMLGPDRRPAIARSLSVVGSDEWVSTPDAIELVKGAIGDREPKRFIVDQARLGSLQVGRSRPSVSRNDRIPNWFGTSGNGMSRRGCGIVLVGSQAKRTGARVSSGLASQKLSAQVG